MVDTDFLVHPLVKANTLKPRLYQETVAATASKKNTLCVLPTGLGKTIIAIMVAANILHKHPAKKVLFLAPTKPLVEQQKKSFLENLNLSDEDAIVLTGEYQPDERHNIWKEKKLYFATPQVVENDTIGGKLDLKDFSLVIFDEAHRARGDFAYTFVAKHFKEKNPDGIILGLTASPGGTEEKIGAICGNLFINHVEIKTEADWDVKPYVQELEINWIKVKLPEDFYKIKESLEKSLSTRLAFLKKLHFLDSVQVGRKDLIALQRRIIGQMQQDKDPTLFQAISVLAAALKISHAVELVQTQGLEQLQEYFVKLRKDTQTKAAQSLLNDQDFIRAEKICNFLVEQKTEHPKIAKLKELLHEKITNGQKSIVFTQYVSTAEKLVRDLSEKNLTPVLFIGQRTGNSQKKQLETLNRFREGEFNVLVATSVAEEGLDIPKVDLVVFYENVASEIRNIQRRGRTGRFATGEVYILMAKGTIDEAYYWAAKNKERKMHSVLKGLQEGYNAEGVTVENRKVEKDEGTVTVGKEQSSLDRFLQRPKDALPIIYTDHREGSLIRTLYEKNAEIRSMQLDVGDFLVSDRCCVERKASADFLQSMLDGRLFSQMGNLSSNFSRPILIIEGESLYGLRNIHPNAIKGALNSILLDFRVPIIWTKNVEETADVLIGLAKREQEDNKREVSIKGFVRPKSLNEWQEMIVGSFPSINIKLAKNLLKHFGSLKNVMNASEEELQKVEKIGPEKSKNIKNVVEHRYESSE